MPKPARPRAVLFIDGNNWYHGLKDIGVSSYALDYHEVANKLLLSNRQLAGIRYYTGKVSGDLIRMRRQEKFFRTLRSQGVNIFPGRIEKNEIPPNRNPLIASLTRILEESGARIPEEIRQELSQLCHQKIPTYTEKQVDVRIAVDLVSMAVRGEYDAAYLLSADGDFVPAVREASRLGKKIFAASASQGRQLGNAVDSFIPLDSDWFRECYR